MFRGNVETPGLTLQTGPRDIRGGPKWTFTTGAAILSSPVVADGKVYINSNDGTLIFSTLTMVVSSGSSKLTNH
jgi:outer membrane protein assembly factor BamB